MSVDPDALADAALDDIESEDFDPDEFDGDLIEDIDSAVPHAAGGVSASLAAAAWCPVPGCQRPRTATRGGYCMGHRAVFALSAAVSDAVKAYLSVGGTDRDGIVTRTRRETALVGQITEAGESLAYALASLIRVQFPGLRYQPVPLTFDPDAHDPRWRVSFDWLTYDPEQVEAEERATDAERIAARIAGIEAGRVRAAQIEAERERQRQYDANRLADIRQRKAAQATRSTDSDEHRQDG